MLAAAFMRSFGIVQSAKRSLISSQRAPLRLLRAGGREDQPFECQPFTAGPRVACTQLCRKAGTSA